MPSARELLEQADALMRRNRARAVDTEIPELTEIVAELPPASPAAVVALGDVPELVDAVEEIEISSIVELPDDIDETSAWMHHDPADWSVVGREVDSIMARLGPANEPASEAGPLRSHLSVVGRPDAAADRAPAVAPQREPEPPAAEATPSQAEPIVSAAEATPPQPEPETPVAQLTPAATGNAWKTSPPVVENASPAIEFAPTAFEAAPPATAIVAEVLAVAPLHDAPPPTSDIATAEATVAPHAEVAATGSPPAASQAPIADDWARWEALAEEIRMQVLQRIDIFTDTRLRKQLSAQLQPIVDRASVQMVETINEEVGRLLRAYIAEAIEREIDKWRGTAR